ncbi:MAG: hypothetical protein U0167_10615 [bacterium]
MNGKRFGRIGPGLAFLAAALAGCGKDTTGPNAPPPPDLSTPRAAIRSMEDVYSRRVYDQALAMLSPNFRFYPAQPESVSFFAPGDTYWGLDRENEMLQRMLVPHRVTWLDQVLLEVEPQEIVDSTATLTRVSTISELHFLLGGVVLQSARSYVDFIYERNAKGDNLLLEQHDHLFPGSLLTYGQLKTMVQSKPSLATLVVNPDSIATTSAVIGGRINPNGLATTAHFDYGLTASYGNSTGDVSVGNDSIEHGIQMRISGLTPATEYHYRVVATSEWGTAYGIDLTFTTRAVP